MVTKFKDEEDKLADNTEIENIEDLLKLNIDII